MHKFHIAIASALAAMQTVISTSAQDLARGEKDTVFIGSLVIQPSVGELAKSKGRDLSLKRVGDSLESQLVTALNATRVFQIVERKRVNDLQLEQAFASVAVKPGDKNAAETLKMAGAKYAFLPQIDGFEDRVDRQNYDAIDRVSTARKLFISGVLKVVDTTTGRLLPESPSVQLSRTETIEMARAGTDTEGDQLILEIAKEMANRMAQGVVALLRPAKVLAVTGKQVLINRGAEAGFKEGEQAEVYAIQEIKDDDTGEVFRNEVAVGQLRIVRGDAKQCFGIIEGEETGIAKGCVVKVVKSANSSATPDPIPQSAPGAALNPASAVSPTGPVSPGSSEKPLNFGPRE